jgi:hypothetical protein
MARISIEGCAMMSDKLIRQAYTELAELRLRRDGAERHRLNTVAADLRERIATSEARIKTLEWATFHVARQ